MAWSAQLLRVSGVVLIVTSSCTIAPMERAPDSSSAPVTRNQGAGGSRIVPCKHEPPGERVQWPSELLSMSQPQYPEVAWEAGSQGTVICHVYVDTTGVVTEAHVSQSVNASLDEAALQSARTAKFKPAMRADKSKAGTWCALPIEFKLH
jgi:TonB family protein